MGKSLKRVGVLTGGGDCPGLNAVIRAVTKASLDGGLEVVGIEDGYLGLIENRMRKLSKQLKLDIELVQDPDMTPGGFKVLDLDKNMDVTDMFKSRK